jgi:hypothetical protein
MFVKLTVAATTDESKIKFLHAMENSSAFSNVELVSIHAAETGGDLATLELNAIYARS